MIDEKAATPPEKPGADCIFVYGTLRRGCNNNYMMSEVGEWVDGGNLLGAHLYWGASPPAVKTGKPQTDMVRGDIYLLKGGVSFAAMDRFEASYGYERRVGTVRMDDGREIPAFYYEYLWEVPEETLVKSGDYKGVLK